MSGSEQKSKHAQALFCRGDGLDEEGRLAGALSAFGRAAHLGDALAQSNLGNLLDDQVTPPRPAEAVYWYKRAVRGGNSNGAWNLAMHYRDRGQGTLYRYWLRVAAAMGNEDALDKRLGERRV